CDTTEGGFDETSMEAGSTLRSGFGGRHRRALRSPGVLRARVSPDPIHNPQFGGTRRVASAGSARPRMADRGGLPLPARRPVLLWHPVTGSAPVLRPAAHHQCSFREPERDVRPERSPEPATDRAHLGWDTVAVLPGFGAPRRAVRR